MTNFKIYKEWICNEENQIVYKPLRFWLEYFGATPVSEYTCKTNKGKFIDVEVEGGYGMNWNEREDYLDKLFFVGNADLDRAKIRIKRG